MVFFAYVLLQLGFGFRIMGNLKANLRTIGSRCRLAGTALAISWRVEAAAPHPRERRILGGLLRPLRLRAEKGSRS